MDRIGKGIVVAGLVIVAIGIIFWLFGDKLRFLGRLPGDINIEKGNTRIFIPITTMLIVSVLLSLVMWIIQRFR